METAHGSSLREADLEIGHPRVLLVDPYGHSREGLGASLRSRGYTVETAGESREAIQKMTEGVFELAIVDLDLQPTRGTTLSGWDLARVLRAFDPGVALILVAAECGPDTRAQADRFGVFRLLEKPISPREVRLMAQSLRQEASSPWTGVA